MNKSDPNDHSPLPDGAGLDPESEVALDAFLAEVIADQSPPDLANQILDQLDAKSGRPESLRESHRPANRAADAAEHSVEGAARSVDDHNVGSIEVSTGSARNRSRSSAVDRRWSLAWIAIAVAASLAGVVWISGGVPTAPDVQIERSPIGDSIADSTSSQKAVRPKQDSPESRPQDGENTDPAGSQIATERTEVEPSILMPTGDQAAPRNESMLDQVAADPADDKVRRNSLTPDQATGLEDAGNPAAQPVPAVQLVSAAIKDQAIAYWKSADVQPTATADIDEVAKRLSVALGVSVPTDVLEDSDSLMSWIRDADSRTANSNRIARRWWNHVSAGQFSSLDDEEQTLLVAPLSASISGKEKSVPRFDQVVSNWLSVPSKASSAFLSMLAGPASSPKSPRLANHLASLTLSADLRCVRCHDSYIEGSSVQQDYWNFAALVANGVKRNNDRLTLSGKSDKEPSPIFFELPDRRQQLAQPAIARQWSSGDGKIMQAKSLSQFSEAIVGSRPLARGLVNSLWSLVHGVPLNSRVVDPMSPPISDSLTELETRLVDDLLASDFDLGRTLVLILQSPTTRRSVPQSLRDVWASDRSEAHQTVIAFAGATPASKPVSTRNKMDQILRSIGKKLDGTNMGLLAQIHPDVSSDAGTPMRTRDRKDSFAWDFPDRAKEFPVPWVSTIKNGDEQVRHLCYLADQFRVPTAVDQAASAMESANVDRHTLLNRVWWLLQK